MRRLAWSGSILILMAGTTVTLAPPSLADSTDPSSVGAVVQGLNAAVSWTDGSTQGVTGYVVSATPQLPTVSAPAGATSAVLTGLRPGVAYTVMVAARTAGGAGTPVAAGNSVVATAPGGRFVGLAPVRLLDTRRGLGAPRRATSLVVLQVTGRGGVPAGGVGSVALNLTVTAPQAAGYVTAYPSGQSRPPVSNVNYVAHETKAQAVVVPVGPDGRVVLYASAPSQLIADVNGYFGTPAAATADTSSVAGLYHPVTPARILDTRTHLGGTTPARNGVVTVQVTGLGGVPVGASSVVLNTTVTQPSGAGFVTAFPTGSDRPDASSINFTAGQTIANRVQARLGSGGRVSFYNGSGGATQLVVDVAGWYTDNSDASAGGSYYVGLAPRRIVDTRRGLGAPLARVGAGASIPVHVAGQAGVPAAAAAMPATAAALSVTEVRPSKDTYTTVFPSLAARPTASDVNVPAGGVASNLTLAGLGVDGASATYNNAGTADYVVDLFGFYVGGVDIPSSTVTPAPGAVSAVSGDPSTGQTVTLAAGQPAPRIGQILTSAPTAAAPAGLLAQVTDTSTDGSGQTTLSTVPATLQQALGNADLAISAPLGSSDVAAVSGLARPVRAGYAGTPLSVSNLHDRARSAAAAAAADGGPVSGSATQHCSGDDTSGLTTTHSFTPSLIFEAHLGHRGFTPTVTARAGMDVNETLGATLSFGGKVSCSWHKQLAKYTFRPIVFTVGDVPVVIVPVFTLTLAADVSGQVSISTSVTQNFHAQAGLQFDSEAAGSGVTPYRSVSNTITHSGPALTAASGRASIALIGDLEGKLYDVAGPEASLTATVLGTIDPTKTPWWKLVFTLTGEAALHFSVLFVHVDVSVDIDLVNATIAQASTAPSSAAPVIVTTSLPGGSVGQAYSTQLTTADHRAGSWAISSGSLPPGLHLSGFTISGTPTSPGTSTFGLLFTESASTHRTATATASITVSGSGTATPTVTISPTGLYSVHPNCRTAATKAGVPSQFTWSVQHFAAGEHLSPNLDSLGWIGDDPTAGSTGSFSTSYDIPQYEAGRYTFEVIGDKGSDASTPVSYFSSGCWFHQVNGSTFTFGPWYGSGFTESTATLTLTGTTTVTSTVPVNLDDLSGSFSGSPVDVGCPASGSVSFTILDPDGHGLSGTMACTGAAARTSTSDPRVRLPDFQASR